MNKDETLAAARGAVYLSMGAACWLAILALGGWPIVTGVAGLAIGFTWREWSRWA